MRRVILLGILTVVHNSAIAELKEVGSNETVAIYVDLSTIEKKGHLSRMLHLTDYKRPQKDMGENYLSTKDQNEYDCKEMKMRRLASSQHSGNMGSGKIVYSDTYITRWKAVPPDSGTEILWNFACEKQKR